MKRTIATLAIVVAIVVAAFAWHWFAGLCSIAAIVVFVVTGYIESCRSDDDEIDWEGGQQ